MNQLHLPEAPVKRLLLRRDLCDMPTVNHNIIPSKYANIGMLIPYGSILHAELQEVKIGARVSFHDGMGVIIEKTYISVNTEFANALSLQLYGIPIKATMRQMIDNWKDRIFTDKLIYIIVKKI